MNTTVYLDLIYRGQSIWAQTLDDGLVELCFDRQDEAINKLDARTVQELGQATAAIAALPGVRGVLISSAKTVFIVGADITEFGQQFQMSEPDLAAHTARSNLVFTALEDLGVPTVVALNGFALGGGLEMALAASFRLMSSQAQIGLPEVKLGLFPGFGGTVRLARVAGPQVAIDWIASGQAQRAPAALHAGVVDAVVEPEQLRAEALAWLERAAQDQSQQWQLRQNRKRVAVPLSAQEAGVLFAQAKTSVAKSSGKHQPAALAAVMLIERCVSLDRSAALAEESRTFAKIAKTQAAAAMVQTFLNEQTLKKLFKQHARVGRPVSQAAVLGAGIMGGGIAYASALRGIPVRLKDISQAQLVLGMREAGQQLAKQVKHGRLTQEKADAIAAAITPQLDDTGLESVDIVIEAVVENIAIKQRVLQDLESHIGAHTIIASNTSSLRIDALAPGLRRPEQLVGMHFFNPVPVMPLVEVIQGEQTSAAAVSAAVGYAVAMGKTPIVVQDCPGFLVNRILTAYVRGFLQLVADGGDFEQIDQVMEKFGWPMGPAYLEDVVGIDTGAHVTDVISAGYPQRMPALAHDALRLLKSEQRFGQKNGLGFYRYVQDGAGKPKRSVDPDTRALLARVQPAGQRSFSEAEIVDRLMLPLLIEAAQALEDAVVGSPAELDMAMLLGVGFPAYLGGPLKWADWQGLAQVCARADAYQHLGPAYAPTAAMRAMAKAGKTYYG